MPFLGTQRCSYDINFPLLITLFLELFRYLVVDCHLRWDILRRFDLRTRITVQSPHALNPMGAPFSPQLNMGSNYLKSFKTDTTMMRRRHGQMRRHTYHWSFERFRERRTLRKPWGRCTFDFRVVHLVLDTMSSFLVSLKGFGFIKLGEELFAGLRGGPWLFDTTWELTSVVTCTMIPITSLCSSILAKMEIVNFEDMYEG